MSIWKKKNVFVMGGLFFLIGTLCLAFLCVNNSNNYVDLDKVTLKANNTIDKSMFAVMIQKEDGSGYEESNTFPSEGTLNMELSGCIDALGNKIPNALSYSGGIVNAEVDSTAYCYLYFDLVFCEEGMPLGECINTIKTLGYNTNLEGGLYRYQGTSVDNYICFGTSNKDKCLENPAAHMYRVIGVDETGRVKVIKRTPLESTMKWYSNNTKNITWPNSTIYKNINDSLFLTNTNYVPSGWYDNIETVNWKYGDNTNLNVTADALYNIENAWNDTVSAKIGLLYAHDYAYAYQSGGLNCFSGVGFGSSCKMAWMHLSKNVLDYPSCSDTYCYPKKEWPMSRKGGTGGYYASGMIGEAGDLHTSDFNNSASVRPVFYLTSDTLYASGDGTISSPFMILNTEILDTAAPIVTASTSSNNTSSPKISITSSEAGTYCVNTTSTPTNFSNCTLTGNISANTAITTNPLTASGTYYVHVKDAAGNVGGSSAISITKVLCNTTDTFGTCLRNAKTAGFNSTMEGGLYRYQGTTNVNNYVCFGTSTKSTCTGNTDRYMYRIIGVDSSNRVKLIKKEALNSTMQWYDNSSSDKTWPNSPIYTNINGASFLTSTTYTPTGWSDKIATISWKYGDNTNGNVTANSLYIIENAWTSTISAKIGLIYSHDYAYAYQSGGVNCSQSGVYSDCKKAWMHLSNCDSGAPDASEWTMSRYGLLSTASGYYDAWSVSTSGYLIWGMMSISHSVRPTFYLNSSVKYVSGSGTLSDPFIIS